jgi:hypothetical protein
MRVFLDFHCRDLRSTLQVPEPDAEGLVTLQDMGFSPGLAAKALLLSHNVPAAALEWALQHSEDADADAPPSEDALRAGGPGLGRVAGSLPSMTCGDMSDAGCPLKDGLPDAARWSVSICKVQSQQ